MSRAGLKGAKLVEGVVVEVMGVQRACQAAAPADRKELAEEEGSSEANARAEVKDAGVNHAILERWRISFDENLVETRRELAGCTMRQGSSWQQVHDCHTRAHESGCDRKRHPSARG